jgi:lipid-A-disaccharide synthase
MVTYYKVTRLTWWLGRPFVNVSHYSMVNLIANRKIVPEIIQDELTGERLAREAANLLDNPAQAERMRHELSEVRAKLSGEAAPMERAAAAVVQELNKHEP